MGKGGWKEWREREIERERRGGKRVKNWSPSDQNHDGWWVQSGKPKVAQKKKKEKDEKTKREKKGKWLLISRPICKVG